MKILSTSQIKDADAFTIENEPVASIDLMERASLHVVNWFVSRFDPKRPVVIFCGKGNNGGDGMAVARMLVQRKYQVAVYTVGEGEGSKDFQENHKRWSRIGSVHAILSDEEIPHISYEAIVIDAIFGSGLTRPLEGIHKTVVEAINQAKKYKVLAIDIASGLFAEKPLEGGVAIMADVTLTFQFPKLAFLLPENEPYVGAFYTLDIGLSNKFISEVQTSHYFLTKPFIQKKIKPRKIYAHKGDFGKALIIAGSRGKMGAAILCCRACLRTGVGLLTAHTPANCWPIMQMAVHEAMVEIDAQDNFFSGSNDFENYDVLGIGPGLGTEDATVEGFKNILYDFKKPIVVDADAINIIAKNPDLLRLVPENSIFTPHPKEFERLAGSFSNDYERLELQKQFSKDHHVIVLLKGAHTSVSTPDGTVYFNATGNSGMATGGSGDTLTGILTSLIAQKYDPLEATLIGVYLHGLAADIAVEVMGKEALLPSDIIEHIGRAYLVLQEEAF